jgi:hypothetical protein
VVFWLLGFFMGIEFNNKRLWRHLRAQSTRKRRTSYRELSLTAIHNWLGMLHEERWWLYTMTIGATGHAINGQNNGWPKDVCFAFTENPMMDGLLRNHWAEFELSLMP